MLIPDLSRRPWKNIHYIILGLIQIADGLVMLLTLATFIPRWHIDYSSWVMGKVIDQWSASQARKKLHGNH